LGEVYKSLSSSLCSFLHFSVPASLIGPNILLSTLFSNILNLRSSLNAGDQVAHPYKTTSKILILYVLIFVFVDSKLEDKRLCNLLTYKKSHLRTRNYARQLLGKFHVSTLLK
jgi:hypothetical protein